MNYRLINIWIFFALFSLACQSTYSQVMAQRPLPGQATLLATLKDGSPAAMVRFSRPKYTHGLAMINPAGSTIESNVYQGYMGVIPGSDSETGNLYFQAAPDLLVTATGTFFVTIQYFDQGQGAVEFRYLSHLDENTVTTRSERFFLGNSGHWNQHTFTMVGAVLDQSFEGNSDFLLHNPNVPIRMVALTRSPMGRTQGEISPMFSQPRVSIPAGFLFGISPSESDGGKVWYDESRIAEKSQLYSSWGTTNVLDTIQGSIMTVQRGGVSFDPYLQRAQRLNAQGLTWVPRFEIGDFTGLPASMQAGLQPAMGMERGGTGPMISLWEPRLIQIYRTLFLALRSGVNTAQLPMVVLDFGGGWGPLLNSTEAGWPDIWAGDPIAQQDLRNEMQQRYRTLTALSQAWGENVQSWNFLSTAIEGNLAPQKAIDINIWYRNAFTNIVQQIVQEARSAFPQSRIIIEIGDNMQYGAVDPRSIAQIASRNNCSVLMVEDSEIPTRSFMWQLLSYHCRRLNVPFGLRYVANASPSSLLGAFYSLVSERGSLFFFGEEQLASDQVWETYLNAVSTLRQVQPARSIAVVFPRTSASAFSTVEYDRIIQQMREYFAFDVVDELDLNLINSTQYPIVFCPWGSIWSENAIQNFSRLARSGGALIAQTDQPWRTLNGNVDFNKDLFAVELTRQNNQWVLNPRRRGAELSDKPAISSQRRIIQMSGGDDQRFISGEWSSPQDGRAFRQQGIGFDSFRWMGERGQVRLPVQSGRNYELIVEGYIPEGNVINVHVNGRSFGQIQGEGTTVWTQPLSVRENNVNLQLRGQTWPAGTIMGATQTFRPSMAVSRIAVLPRGQTLDDATVSSDPTRSRDFERGDLRGSWMRELGQGVTLIAPTRHVTPFLFMDLMNAIVMNPGILNTRFSSLSFPPDNAINNLYVSPIAGNSSVYLNLSGTEITVRNTIGRRTRTNRIPPMRISYFN